MLVCGHFINLSTAEVVVVGQQRAIRVAWSLFKDPECSCVRVLPSGALYYRDYTLAFGEAKWLGRRVKRCRAMYCVRGRR